MKMFLRLAVFLNKSVRKYILSNPTQKIKSLETVRFQSFLIGPSGET